MLQGKIDNHVKLVDLYKEEFEDGNTWKSIKMA
jgi:hypothetical protein